MRLPLWIAALWWGSLSTIGFIVVPMLFAHLPSAAVAGNMAGKLFSAQTWIYARMRRALADGVASEG